MSGAVLRRSSPYEYVWLTPSPLRRFSSRVLWRQPRQLATAVVKSCLSSSSSRSFELILPRAHVSKLLRTTVLAPEDGTSDILDLQELIVYQHLTRRGRLGFVKDHRVPVLLRRVVLVLALDGLQNLDRAEVGVGIAVGAGGV